MCFDSLYVPTSGNQGDLAAVEKDWYRNSSRSRSISRGTVSGKGFSHRQHRFTRCTYFSRSTVIKKSFEKSQKENRDLDSEDVEELAKQTLLSTEEKVEMWATHLDSVKKRRQAGARKAAATRKQKSARQSSDKVATAGNEFWPRLFKGWITLSTG